ncbi:alpha-amylase family glycosyl hydrolase [Lachnospiraceae bacterium 62-35]
MNTWYEKAVFYHMYPLGMTGAPKQNDSTDIIHRFEELDKWIPHIRDLGCTAVYIGPLFESSSHGYDTRDYKITDRRLGDNNDFIRFVSLCHENGIKVVVDGVFNHTGREFFAFRDIQEKKWDSPYKDWYKGVRFDWGSPLGDPFAYEAWHGIADLPTLNLQNPEVKTYLFDVIRYWVDTFDIDGIRLDCANVLDFQFMKEMRAAVSSMKEDFWLMGEVIHGDYARWVNPEMLHSVTNYELHKSLYSGHNDHNYFEIAHNVRRLEAIGRELYTFVDNHDEDRIASKLNLQDHLFPIHLLLFTLPGIPSIYYGSEWEISGKRTNTCDDMLRPAIHPEEFEERNCLLTEQIKKLAHIHLEHQAFHRGKYKELFLTNRQYAFSRTGEAETVAIAVNNDEKECTISIPVDSCFTAAQELLGGLTIPVENGRLNIELPAADGKILKLLRPEEISLEKNSLKENILIEGSPQDKGKI